MPIVILQNGEAMKNEFDFKPGDIIHWLDEDFRVLKNYGDSGEVEALDGAFVSNNFYWNYGGVKAKKVKDNQQMHATANNGGA